MIRTILAASASALALSLATPAFADDNPEDKQEAATPTMSFGTWGVDPGLLSDTVDPGDDFFAYVNQD